MEQRPPHAVSPVRLLVLSGPSGSGKSTVVDRLLTESASPVREAISATTRGPRPGEIDGKDYYFLDQEEFAARRERGEFVECAEVHGVGDWYGTLRSELQRAADVGAWALLEIDVEGALNVMQQYPEALTIFLQAPSMEEYTRRLQSRGTESSEEISRRLETAAAEVTMADRYQYQVVNDDLDGAVGEIIRILSVSEVEDHA